MPAPLLPIERKVYHFLLDYLAEQTFQPSVREIARRFRIRSTKTVTDILGDLERKGYIERVAGRSRGVRLVGYAGPVGTRPVPLYSRAHAAPPALRREDIVRHYVLDRAILPSDDAFLVLAVGDSCAAHGILDGDLVIVHPSARLAESGTAAMRIGDWIHVVSVRREGASLILEPGGESATPERLGAGDDYAVLGVTAGVVRAAGSAQVVVHPGVTGT